MKHWTLFLLLLSLSTPAWAKTTTTKQPAARKAAPATTKATKATKVTVLSGVLKAITEATMITTRLIVLPTAWVTGLTFPSARKATSL